MDVKPASFKRENVGVAGPAPQMHVSESICNNNLTFTSLARLPV